MMQMGAANWEPYNSEVNVAFCRSCLHPWTMPGKPAGEFGQQFCEKLLEPTGVTILSVWESGYRHMTNNTSLFWPLRILRASSSAPMKTA